MRWTLAMLLLLFGAALLGGCCCFDDDEDDRDCGPSRNKPHVANEVKHHDGWRR